MTDEKKNNPRMQSNSTTFPELEQIRKQAELITQSLQQPNFSSMTPEEMQQQFYELHVKQNEADLLVEQLRSHREESDEQTELFSIVTENMLDMVALTDMEGNVTYAGKTHEVLGYKPGFLIGKNVMDFIHPEDFPYIMKEFGELVESGLPRKVEYRYRCEDGTYLWLETMGNFIADENGISQKIVFSSRDITECKSREDERRELIARLLALINSASGLREIISALLATLQSWSGAEAIGIRLVDGEDFPYYETRGFPHEFIEAESHLCVYGPDGKILRNGQGNPVLECMCGNVISGSCDPSKPFFTNHGSFWTHSTSALLAGTTEADRQGRTRNRCHGEGYESVVLIPLRTGDQTFGLLQFNDPRPGQFTREQVAYFESVADSMAAGLAQHQAEEALRKSEERYRQLAENTEAILWEYDINADRWTYVAPQVKRILGFDPEEWTNLQFWVDHIHPEDRMWASNYCEECKARGLSHELEYRFLTKNGDVRWVRDLVNVELRDGLPDKMRGCIFDITERKRDETAVRKSEQTLKDIFESTLSGYWDWNLVDNTEYLSPTFKRMFGYEDHEMESSPEAWQKIIFPEDLPGVLMVFDHHVKSLGQEPFYNEIRYRHRDGSTVWVICAGRVIEWAEDGTAIRMVGCHIDITERKRSEEALSKSQKIMSRAEDLADLGSWEWNITNDTWQFSDNWKKIHGVDHPYLTTPQLIQIAHPEDRPTIEEIFARAVEKGDPYDIEHRIVRQDTGEVRYVHAKGMLELDVSGKPIFLLGAVQDITTRKQAEAALRKSEERHRRLFETMTQGVVYQDTNGKIISANPAAKRILGLSFDQMRGKMSVNPRWRMIKEDGTEVPDTDHPVMIALRTGETVGPVIQGVFHPDKNTYIWMSMTLIPLFQPGETKAFQAYATFEDITNRIQAEAEKEKLQAQLSQAQKMESVGRLAGGVAHDFNNKLAIINGYAEMTMEMIDSLNPLHEMIQEIHTAGRQSADIVRQLLAFARQQTISPVLLDLNDNIASMLKMLQRLIGENIDLIWHPGKNLWPVKIDPSQVDQVMANLAVNARDAISDVGKLTIEMKNTVVDEEYCKSNPDAIPGQYIMLAVSDDGFGMDKEVQQRIFDPYFTTKEIGKGTGLGLPTIYGIVKQNNGFINVYSEPGEGTTFKLYFPVCETEKSSMHAPKASIGQMPTGTETILLVEDEPALLKMGKGMIERLGYTVLTAGNPNNALKVTGDYEGTINLLITDVVMPEMNGRDLASQLNGRQPGLKTLYMSGYTADVIAHHGVLDEGVQFIQKPFSLKDMALKIREAIEQE